MTEQPGAHPDRSAGGGDVVRRYLASRGVAGFLIDGGLSEMASRWQAIATSAERYELTLDDWLNDVDLRDILAGAIDVASEPDRAAVRSSIDRSDAVFRAATVETGPLWGAAVAASDGHDRARQWWYFRRPKHPGAELAEELKTAGLLELHRR